MSTCRIRFKPSCCVISVNRTPFASLGSYSHHFWSMLFELLPKQRQIHLEDYKPSKNPFSAGHLTEILECCNTMMLWLVTKWWIDDNAQSDSFYLFFMIWDNGYGGEVSTANPMCCTSKYQEEHALQLCLYIYWKWEKRISIVKV